MEKTKIDRINLLHALEKERGLTQEEKEEQAKLRREFIDDMKEQLRLSLESLRIVDENGNEHKVQPKNANEENENDA